MPEKTNRLTAAEIAALDTVQIVDEVQRATIALRRATGMRYGVTVKQARYDIVLTAYAFSAAGKPRGVATVEVVTSNLQLVDLIPSLKALGAAAHV